jgi:hypothetical protein
VNNYINLINQKNKGKINLKNDLDKKDSIINENKSYTVNLAIIFPLREQEFLSHRGKFLFFGGKIITRKIF